MVLTDETITWSGTIEIHSVEGKLVAVFNEKIDLLGTDISEHLTPALNEILKELDAEDDKDKPEAVAAEEEKEEIYT